MHHKDLLAAQTVCSWLADLTSQPTLTRPALCSMHEKHIRCCKLQSHCPTPFVVLYFSCRRVPLEVMDPGSLNRLNLMYSAISCHTYKNVMTFYRDVTKVSVTISIKFSC